MTNIWQLFLNSLPEVIGGILTAIVVSLIGYLYTQVRHRRKTTTSTETAIHDSLPVASRIRHNLPQPDYGKLIGREQEVEQVMRLLRPYPHSQHALIAIEGAGGIGKTALGLEVAHRYLRRYSVLPEEECFEAIIWVSAKQATLTAESIFARRQTLSTVKDIYTTISVVLDRTDITAARSEDQLELVRKALTQQRTLLIVDNLETIDDKVMIEFLHEIPAPTKCIVTTRHKTDIAYPIQLRGMLWEDACTFIKQECQKKTVRLSHDQCRKLYDCTGGVPLVIVWTIARLGFGYTFDTILRQLGDPQSDITRFCFESAMELIRNKDSHKLLMALTFFGVKGANRDVLGKVVKLDGDILTSRDIALVELEKLSLVNRFDHRFTILPLTRQLASKELLENPDFDRRIKQSFVRYFVQMVQNEFGSTYWSGWGKWAAYQVMADQTEDILTAIDIAADMQMWQSLRDLVIGTVHLLCWIGWWERRIHVVQAGIVAAQAIESREDEAWLRVDGLAWIYLKREEYDQCLAEIQSGLGIAQTIGQSGIIVQAGCLKARVLMARRGKDYRSIEEMLLPLLEIPCNPMVRGDLLETVGNLAELREDYGASERHYREFIDVYRDLGKANEAAEGLILLGRMYLKTDKLDQARLAFQEATSLMKSTTPDARTHAEVLLGIGLLELRVGNRKKARQLLEESRSTLERLGLYQKVSEASEALKQIYST